MLDGTYGGDELLRNYGGIIEVLETTATVQNREQELHRQIVQRTIVLTERPAQTLIEEATQPVDFAGSVSDTGEVTRTGTTRAS